jgi:hypothetical protein
MKHSASRDKSISEKICILYEKSSGRIAHIHRAVTMAGGHEFTKEVAESRAWEHAKIVGHEIEGLDILLVAADEFDTLSSYRVDPVSKKLQRVDTPAELRMFTKLSGLRP